MKYSIGFRTSVLRKVLPAESRSVYQMARESGISVITIQSWLSKLKEGTLEVAAEGNEPTPSQRSPAEKFRLLMQGKLLPEDQRGEWLRQNGLHSEHLNLWEQELTQLMTNKQEDLLLTLKKKLDARFGVDEEA